MGETWEQTMMARLLDYEASSAYSLSKTPFNLVHDIAAVL
jgi:hypothetical protein